MGWDWGKPLSHLALLAAAYVGVGSEGGIFHIFCDFLVVSYIDGWFVHSVLLIEHAIKARRCVGSGFHKGTVQSGNLWSFVCGALMSPLHRLSTGCYREVQTQTWEGGRVGGSNV